MEVRRAVERDGRGVTEALSTAFASDPVWGWAVPDPDARAEFWGFFARNGIARRSVWVLDDARATAVWVAPGSVELDEAGEAELERLCHELLGADAARVMDTLAVLDGARPTEPHHYLSLLATHDDHRGHGFGMALLRESLRRIDAAGEPAYLESTNPANLERYASVGFQARDQLRAPNGSVVTTMWRPAVP